MNHIEIDHKMIEQITKSCREDQDSLLRYYSRIPLALKITTENKRKKIFHSLRQQYTNINNAELSYAALILSLKYLHAIEKSFTSKNLESLTIEEIRDISMVKIIKDYEKSYLRNSPKRDKLLHYWAIVKLCRKQKPKPMSFMKISVHLKKKYNFKVGHNLIAQMWSELESKSINEGEKNG